MIIYCCHQYLNNVDENVNMSCCVFDQISKKGLNVKFQIYYILYFKENIFFWNKLFLSILEKHILMWLKLHRNNLCIKIDIKFKLFYFVKIEVKNRECREDCNSQLNRPTNSTTCSLIMSQTVTDNRSGSVKKNDCEAQHPGNSNFCPFCEVFSLHLLLKIFI